MKTLIPLQDRCVTEMAGLVTAGSNVLLVAPTGVGKTGMALSLAARVGGSGGLGKVMILTHRRKLFSQIVETDAEEWLESPVGRFAALDEGGIDQRPDIVVAMVQTAAARASDLAGYGLVIIDEAHHARGEEEGEDPTGDYEIVLAALEAANPLLRVVGQTATPFRADEKGLNRRVADASEVVITYGEAIAAERILMPRTVRPAYLLKNGKAPGEMVAELIDRRGYDLAQAEIGSLLQQLRRDDFHAMVARDLWDGNRVPRTLCFTDTVSEARDLMRACIDIGIEARLVAAENGARANNKAFDDYESGIAPVLVSCRMIGEGYNVPDTERVVTLNRNTTRAWYAQMIGRAMRAGHGKKEAAVTDYGASSFFFGRLEDQIGMQSVRSALASATNKDRLERVLLDFGVRAGRGTGVVVFPSKEKSWFVAAEKTGFAVFERSGMAGRDSVNRSSGNLIHRIRNGRDSLVWSLEDLAGLMLEETKTNEAWHASTMTPCEEGKGDGAITRRRQIGLEDFREAAGSLEKFLGRRFEAEPARSGGAPSLDEKSTRDGEPAMEALIRRMETPGTDLVGVRRGFDALVARSEGKEILVAAAQAAGIFARKIQGPLKPKCQAIFSSVIQGGDRKNARQLGAEDLSRRLRKTADLMADVSDYFVDRGQIGESNLADVVYDACDKVKALSERSANAPRVTREMAEMRA